LAGAGRATGGVSESAARRIEVKHAVVSADHVERVSDRELAARTDAITRMVVFLRLLRLITGHIGSGPSGG